MNDVGPETAVPQNTSFLKFLLVGEGLSLSEKDKKKLGGGSLREAIGIVTDILEGDYEKHVVSSWLPLQTDGQKCLVLRRPILRTDNASISDGVTKWETQTVRLLLLTPSGCYMHKNEFTAYLSDNNPGMNPVLSPEDTVRIVDSLGTPELPEVMRNVQKREHGVDGRSLLMVASLIQALWEEGITEAKQSKDEIRLVLAAGNQGDTRELRFGKINEDEAKRNLALLYR